MTAAESTTTTETGRAESPSLDEALAQAARCLRKAETTLPETAAKLNETAHHWLDMANILLARHNAHQLIRPTRGGHDAAARQEHHVAAHPPRGSI